MSSKRKETPSFFLPAFPVPISSPDRDRDHVNEAGRTNASESYAGTSHSSQISDFEKAALVRVQSSSSASDESGRAEENKQPQPSHPKRVSALEYLVSNVDEGIKNGNTDFVVGPVHPKQQDTDILKIKRSVNSICTAQ